MTGLTVCAAAAEGGHLEVLVWLRENGCPWCEDLEQLPRIWPVSSYSALDFWLHVDCCALAAKGGYLDVLKFLKEQDCPWDAWTLAGAAEAGHLDVLVWAREHGCPWDEELEDWDKDCCALAFDGGHLEMLQWAREHHTTTARGMRIYVRGCFGRAAAGFVAVVGAGARCSLRRVDCARCASALSAALCFG